MCEHEKSASGSRSYLSPVWHIAVHIWACWWCWTCPCSSFLTASASSDPLGSWRVPSVSLLWLTVRCCRAHMRQIHVHQKDDKVSPVLSQCWKHSFPICRAEQEGGSYQCVRGRDMIWDEGTDWQWDASPEGLKLGTFNCCMWVKTPTANTFYI